MKKKVYLIIALFCVVQVFGQKVNVMDGYITKEQILDMPNQKMEKARDSKEIGPNRTVSNNVYYTMPGVLYAGWTESGSGYIYSMAEVPPFVDVTFANQMADKSQYIWQINETDVTKYADENGDYITRYTPHGQFNTPILISPRNNAVYQFNEENYWVKSDASRTTNDLSLITTYSEFNGDVLMMTATDLHGSRLSGNKYASSRLTIRCSLP